MNLISGLRDSALQKAAAGAAEAAADNRFGAP